MSQRTWWWMVWLMVVSVGIGGAGAQGVAGLAEQTRLGVVELQRWYAPAGVYATTGWWNSANALTVVADYDRAMGTREHAGVFANSLAEAPKQSAGFLNDYYDDEGWWALAWVAAYDVTGERRYLEAAEGIFADMRGGWDGTCGGGIWWSKERRYKNAIANELFLSVAAHLANRVGAAEKAGYVDWAQREWSWFQGTGMINDEHLVNDGLVLETCKNNGKTVWTYNQGVVLGGLAELSRASGDKGVLETAGAIAGATIAKMTDANGVLHEPCEPKCGEDGVQFKGIFVRNLEELEGMAGRPEYVRLMRTNAESLWARSRDANNAFGVVWSGPFGTPAAGSQSSALDAFVAALAEERRAMKGAR